MAWLNVAEDGQRKETVKEDNHQLKKASLEKVKGALNGISSRSLWQENG
jgi:hypothetical protein